MFFLGIGETRESLSFEYGLVVAIRYPHESPVRKRSQLNDMGHLELDSRRSVTYSSSDFAFAIELRLDLTTNEDFSIATHLRRELRINRIKWQIDHWPVTSDVEDGIIILDTNIG